ncbi:MAG: HAD superfamily hydrolase (TIGR01509 family) [Planctomycetota bacterium]|jgi:HAD superfamily hydrolase (TIGR01509 family)
MINWSAIDTVLLDMDGTLLDLHFDTFFWQEHLPLRYAQINQIDEQLARQDIHRQTGEIRGTLNWYCTDYWSRILDIDVIELKSEICHKISVRPHCVAFLDALRSAGKEVVMVTNAHQDSLALKMEVTQIADKFDSMITVHEFSLPKENPLCWSEVNKRHPFEPATTLLIDDNLQALHSARDFGIKYLLAIDKPDSKGPCIDTDDFLSIRFFDEIMPIAPGHSSMGKL